MQIDENSKIPKYMQIRSWIYGMIRRGKIKVGDKLPPEEELASMFGVNRMTVRQAFEEFTVEKMILRKRGEGTFLISDKPRDFVYGLENISSFTDDMIKLGITPVTKTLKTEVIQGDSEILELLELPTGSKVIHTLRVKLADGEAVLIEKSYLPFEEFKEVLNMDLNKSLYHTLVKEFDINLHHSTQVFSAVIAGDDDRKIFAKPAPCPCIKLVSVTYDPEDIPVEILKSLYRGDKYKFKAESGEYLFQI